MRYRVTAEYKSIHQLIIEATSPEEAEYFAKDIDLDKWQFIDGDYEVVDESKDFFLKRVKTEQSESADDSALPSIVTKSE